MSAVLNRDFQVQQYFSWCAPASVRVALSVHGLGPSQGELAQSLDTTDNGTDSSYQVEATLESYLGAGLFSVQEIGGSDTTPAATDELGARIRNSIDRGYAVVANVVGPIFTNEGWQFRYDGGHYVAITGYDDQGNVFVSDVAVREYWVTLGRMATWIAGRAYTYLSAIASVPAPTTPPTVTPGEPFLWLADIASPYQDGFDYYAAKAVGVDIVNVKTSQGMGYTNPNFASSVAAGRAAGLGIGTFHWLDSSGSGAAQAQRAFNIMQSVGTDGMAHFCDCEDDASYDVFVDYMFTMMGLLGRVPALYTGDWWWEARGWNGADVTPYLHAAPNDGYLAGYPGDNSGEWYAGYGGWDNLSAMQFSVAPIPGVFSGQVSQTMIRAEAWSALSGIKVVETESEEDDEVAKPTFQRVVQSTKDDTPPGSGNGNSIVIVSLLDNGRLVKTNMGAAELTGPVAAAIGQNEIIYVEHIGAIADA